MGANEKPLIIGIAGGSGSGKTTLAKTLQDVLGEGHVLLLHHDNYYKDRTSLTPEQRAAINYDHPGALETSLLVEHLCALSCGQAVTVPIYDFDQHARLADGLVARSKAVIIVEGILILSDPKLRSQFDVKVFVDVEDDLCFIRRLRRDMAQRGRTFDAVVDQYIESVKPMYKAFVLPSKQHADVIVSRAKNKVVIDMLVGLIQRRTT